MSKLHLVIVTDSKGKEYLVHINAREDEANDEALVLSVKWTSVRVMTADNVDLQGVLVDKWQTDRF